MLRYTLRWSCPTATVSFEATDAPNRFVVHAPHVQPLRLGQHLALTADSASECAAWIARCAGSRSPSRSPSCVNGWVLWRDVWFVQRQQSSQSRRHGSSGRACIAPPRILEGVGGI